MKKKAALYISVLGHPLLTISVFVIIVMFQFEEFNKALLISFLIVGCVILPNVIRNIIKTRKDEYTNFDVSVKSHRTSMYLFAIPLLGGITAFLFISGQSVDLSLSILFGLILLVISFLVNFRIKCSGHVSFTIYLSFLIMPLNVVLGIVVLLAAGFIGWSRVELGRHTVKEIITGAVIGVTTGIAMMIVEGFINL